MELKYPHARLMVYDCLVNEGVGCVQALVRSAGDLGLIKSKTLTTLKLPIETPECGSLFAAKYVLEQCLVERGYCMTNGGKQLADKLWEQITSSIEQYKTETNLVHVRQPGQVSPVIECSHMAPVVMDILLQHLQPYA